MVLAFGMSSLAPPASASHGPDQHSQNMKHLSNVPRSSVATQSDLAFVGKRAFAGNYNGFRILDVSDPNNPVVVRDVWCPGPQDDISVWGDAIVLSVDSVRLANPDRAGANASDCDSIAAAGAQVLDPDGWEGVRIFSLSQILSMTPDPDGFVRPVAPAAAIYTDCGSHTHTGVPHGGHVDAYIASYPLRSGPGCGPGNPQGEDPLHRKISIVRVNPSDPASSSFLKEVPIDVPTWNLLPPPDFNPMQGCHDIQVHLGLDQAAAACSSVGQVWDISDPENPDTLSPLWEVDEPAVQFYHSGLFSQDRSTVVFGDEIISGNCNDGTGSGQLWFHDRSTGALQSSFQIPRDQGGAYCSAHLFNNIPTDAGDFLVASWYTGGVTVVDFNDRSDPSEIGYYDIPGNNVWSAYWYNGFIYGNDISRGFDIYLLSDPARAGARKVGGMNPQTQ
jgi:hypothetical protein